VAIRNIEYLFPSDDDDRTTQVRKKETAVSRHEVELGEKKYVFGWDQPLMSFFLQVHDLVREDEDDQIVVALGASPATQMYEVEDLVRAAAKHGLNIDHATQVKLYGEKDDGI
jgi:pyrroline-5-carboxylate reductase